MNQHPTTTALSVADLEQVYEALATAIDQIEPSKAELFLVKLVLLQAQAIGDARLFQTQIEAALRDL